MRQTHRAGETLFVDYAGQAVPVIDQTTGEVRQAQMFVAVLGAFNYTYAEASFRGIRTLGIISRIDPQEWPLLADDSRGPLQKTETDQLGHLRKQRNQLTWCFQWAANQTKGENMSNSFTVFSIGTTSLQDMADSMGIDDLRDPALLESYTTQAANALNAANEITMDYDVLGSATTENIFISCESYGGGFRSGCKPESEEKDVEYFTSLDGWLEKLKQDIEGLADRRVDINRILLFGTTPPSLEEIEEDGIVGRICEEFGVAIEVYVYSADDHFMYYNAWDDGGDIDEGFLDDPDDDDWAFTPQFHKSLSQFL